MDRPVKAEPSAAPFTIADADTAVADAHAKRMEALAAVTEACRAFPGMSDRRVIADLQRLNGYEGERLANPSLSPEQRKGLEARVAFHAAVAAETEAINALSAAEKVRDDLQAAVDLAALGDGRQALADAIAVHAEADRLARANAAALERAEMGVIETYSTEDEADRALKAAKEAAPSRIAAEYRGETLEPAPTVAEAEAALAAIRQKRVDIRAARDALDKETSSSRHRAEWDFRDVKAAAAFVVKSSPEARALVAAFAVAERQHARLKQAVEALARMDALPIGDRFNAVQDVYRSTEMAWIGALTALATDATAKLPEVA